MSQQADPLVFTLSSQADADGAVVYTDRNNLTIVGYSVGGTVGGAPSAATIDIQEGGTDVETALDISTYGYFDLDDPVLIDAQTAIDIDVNFTGGTSPTFTGNITLFTLRGLA